VSLFRAGTAVVAVGPVVLRARTVAVETVVAGAIVARAFRTRAVVARAVALESLAVRAIACITQSILFIGPRPDLVAATGASIWRGGG